MKKSLWIGGSLIGLIAILLFVDTAFGQQAVVRRLQDLFDVERGVTPSDGETPVWNASQQRFLWGAPSAQDTNAIANSSGIGTNTTLRETITVDGRLIVGTNLYFEHIKNGNDPSGLTEGIHIKSAHLGVTTDHLGDYFHPVIVESTDAVLSLFSDGTEGSHGSGVKFAEMDGNSNFVHQFTIIKEHLGSGGALIIGAGTNADDIANEITNRFRIGATMSTLRVGSGIFDFIENSNHGANEKKWLHTYAASGRYDIQTRSDDNLTTSNALTIFRSGVTPTNVTVHALTSTSGTNSGAIVVQGGLGLWGGINAGGSVTAEDVVVHDDVSMGGTLTMTNNAAPTDAKRWEVIVQSNGSWSLVAVNDAQSVFNNAFSLQRDGATVSQIHLIAETNHFEGLIRIPDNNVAVGRVLTATNENGMAHWADATGGSGEGDVSALNILTNNAPLLGGGDSNVQAVAISEFLAAVNLEPGTDVQAYDANLDEFAAQDVTSRIRFQDTVGAVNDLGSIGTDTVIPYDTNLYSFTMTDGFAISVSGSAPTSGDAKFIHVRAQQDGDGGNFLTNGGVRLNIDTNANAVTWFTLATVDAGSNVDALVGGPFVVQEEDGTPTVFGVNRLRVTNGSLTDNGNGDVSIATTGAGSTPGGSDGQLQFNESGSFAGTTNFTYDVAVPRFVASQFIDLIGASGGLKFNTASDVRRYEMVGQNDGTVDFNALDAGESLAANTLTLETDGTVTFHQGLGATTTVTPTAGDNDTSVATTEFVQDSRHLALAIADLSDATTPSVLTAEETTNKLISNYQTTGADHVFTMPAAHVGGNVTFVIGDEFQVDIEPNSGDLFYLNGTAMAADEHIVNSADTLGDTIVGFVANINGTLRWMFRSADANWVEATP